MTPILRYLAAVCLAIGLAALLVTSDELARDGWPAVTGCPGGLRTAGTAAGAFARASLKARPTESGTGRCPGVVARQQRQGLENS